MSAAHLELVLVSLFPQIIEQSLEYGVIKRAFANKKASIKFLNYRDYTADKHQTVDDKPFGGGSGMVLKPDVCLKALSAAKQHCSSTPQVIALAPAGIRLTQPFLKSLLPSFSHTEGQKKSLVIFCGRYEGFDQRFLDDYVDTCLSVGDFVMSGGEYPALCLIDALCRLIPGTLSQASLDHESFNQALLDYPNYTKPINFNGNSVPPVLLTGNHARIETWRREQAQALTSRWRPDLLIKPLEIEQ